MMSLLLLIFVLQLVIYTLNAAGNDALNELLWSLYNKTPLSSTSTQVAKASKLRGELVKLKREINATSAQDDFAKWAKLRRQMDKLTAEYEKISASVQGTKSSFTSKISTARMVLTSLLPFFLTYWYRSTALFWLPKGWVPYYAEWILSFPKAPLGSVSVAMWSRACAAVIGIVGEAFIATLALGMKSLGEKRMERAKAKVEKEKMGEKKVS